MSLIVSRTPFRISFFGGGTDYPAWYTKNGGAVLSTAIDKYCYITGRYHPPYFPNRHRVVWAHIESVQSISEILHPAVKSALIGMGFDDHRGVEILYQGDMPARSGIGSSSSFAVGLINVLAALRGETKSAHELALAAIDLEQNHLRETVGSQDQVAAAYGGFNIIRFNTDGSIQVDPVGLSDEIRRTLEGRLMMVFTGANRTASEIATKVVQNLDAKNRHVTTMHRMVFEALDRLRAGDLDAFGRMLHETWRLKRDLADNISTSTVDEIYDTAMAAGALGGKLLGAGGAGFMVFYVPEAEQERFRAALRHLIHVPIKFDFSGSTLIYRADT